MTRAEKQLKRRFDILDDAEKTLTEGITKTQSEIYEEIIKILEPISSRNYLVYDREAVKMINAIEDKIKRILTKTGYKERVTGYLLNFDKVKEVNIKIQSSINKIDISGIGLTNLQRGAQQQAINNLLGAGLNTNFIQPIKDVIFQHAVSGAGVADTELALKAVIKGDSERLGRLDRYVTQMARDSINGYDGLIQQRILNEFELDAFSYEGSIIKDSRPQCVRWVKEFNGVLKISELDKEIKWAYNNGSGMIPNTTVDNFAVNRGGYSCRHSCTAIRLN